MEEHNRPVPRNFFEDWKDREALAESMDWRCRSPRITCRRRAKARGPHVYH